MLLVKFSFYGNILIFLFLEIFLLTHNSLISSTTSDLLVEQICFVALWDELWVLLLFEGEGYLVKKNLYTRVGTQNSRSRLSIKVAQP